jgi:hypothetical protein
MALGRLWTVSTLAFVAIKLKTKNYEKSNTPTPAAHTGNTIEKTANPYEAC